MSSTTPQPRVTIKNLATSKDHEVFMSFGLLDQLVILVRDVQLIPELSFNADVRSRAIAVCLAERDAQGRPLSADVNFDISVEDAHRLLDWMAEHLFDFFLKRLREHLKHVQSRASDLQAVGSLLTGSQTSVSSTPSSSP